MAEKPNTAIVKPRPTPAQFVQQVRNEVNKVTWPKRKEVIVTTIMVFWMVLIVTLFLFVVDFTFQHAIRALFRWLA